MMQRADRIVGMSRSPGCVCVEVMALRDGAWLRSIPPAASRDKIL
jgi:hypothetical protein